MKLRDGFGLTAQGVAAVIVALMLAVTGVIVGVAASLDRAACTGLGNTTTHATRWTFLNGCFIHTADGWVPTENWRQIGG